MSPIRVIAGSAKGKKLKMVPGDSTRPVTDRVKEAFFNIIRLDLPGCAFLDLFAGTGSVGIEALSQGAGFVRFAEKNRRALQVLRENLKLTDLESSAEVLPVDAFALTQRRPDRRFDYIYIAPPQYKGMWSKAMLLLDENPDLLVEDGWAIVQIDPKEYEPLSLVTLDEFDQRRYGNTLLVFYERIEADER
jgi:16S rRNA (guanine(966)-N(2))-methyltransferase RsmD